MTDRQETLTVTVKSIQRETRDAISYYLEPSQPLHYFAGQFLTLLLNINGKPVRRSYSLGSAPGIDPQIFITVKRKTNGEVSRYIQDHWTAGTAVHCLAPAGRFVLDELARPLYVFIAAGSGIVPIFSLLKEVLYHFPDSRVKLLYQNRNEEEVIYRQQLADLQARFNGRFELQMVYSNPLAPLYAPQRLNNHWLEQWVQHEVSGADAVFYTCGPQAFMRMVQFTLRLAHYEEEQIRKENFVIEEPFVPADIDRTPRTVQVRYRGRDHRFTVVYPETVLGAALAAGIELPYSCRGGRCSTCTAVCTQGRVRMSVNDVLTEKNLAEGLILTCTAHPETDLQIVFP